MFLAVRTGALRWLRLALAVLALVASQASVARAALGTTCARTGTTITSAAGAAAITANRATPHEVARAALPDGPSDAPVQAADVLPCASGVAMLPAIVDVPDAITAWDAAAPPLAPQTRPSSRVPPPPFRPPRAS